jgi:hypothetical protein
MLRMLPVAVAGFTLALAPVLALAATGTAATSSTRSSVAKPLNADQAKKEIELDGYKQVQDLQKKKGGWTATAMEGQQRVSLLVDNRGVEKINAPNSK